MSSQVRLPGFGSAAANIFVPAGGFSFAGHFKVLDTNGVARMVRAHRDFWPAINASPEIHQPSPVRKRDALRLEFGLLVLSRPHLREQMIIRPVHDGGGSPLGIVKTNRLPVRGFPARVELDG